MITIVYKDKSEEDVTLNFRGRVDTQNYYQVIMFLTSLKIVEYLKIEETPKDYKQED